MTVALCWESLCARAGSPTLPGTPTCRAACGNTTVSRVDRAETPQTRVDRAVNHLWSMALWSCMGQHHIRASTAQRHHRRASTALSTTFGSVWQWTQVTAFRGQVVRSDHQKRVDRAVNPQPPLAQAAASIRH